MELHLEDISRTVASGAHCALVVDRASCHTSAKLKLPTKITLIPLPPYAPELSPTGNILSYLRKNKT
jgi:transposase